MDEFENIERWFGTEDPDELLRRYDTSSEMLASGDMETWLGLSAEAGVTDEARDHFRNDWLAGSAVGASGDEVIVALQEGFSAALADARDNGMRTSIVWIQRGSEFSIGHVVGGNGVTVVISVPEGTVAAEQAQR